MIWIRTTAVLLLWSTATTGPLRAQRGSATTTADNLYRGWIIELLDRDLDAAKHAYRLAADSRGPSPAATVANARLFELARLRGDSDALRDHGQRLPSPKLLALGRSARRALPFAENYVALLGQVPSPKRDAQLNRLRRIIAGQNVEGRRARSLTANALTSRPVLIKAYMAYQRQQDEAIEQMRSKLARLKNTDPAGALKLRERMQTHAGTPSQARRAGLIRRYCAVIADRHLQGNHESAQQLTRTLAPRQGNSDLLRPAQIPHQANYPALLKRAQQRLDAYLATTATSELAHERAVMVRLHARLVEKAAAGDHRSAVELVARLPQYGRMLLDD